MSIFVLLQSILSLWSWGLTLKFKKNMTQIHEHICLELIFYPSTLFDTSTYTCLSIVHLRICTKYCICNYIYQNVWGCTTLIQLFNLSFNLIFAKPSAIHTISLVEC